MTTMMTMPTMTATLEANGSADYFVEIDDEDVWEMLPNFLANRRRDVSVLREAVEGGDLPTVQRLGHNMKGAGSAYGFPEITHLGAGLESAARAADAATALDLTARLEDYLTRVEVVPAFELSVASAA